MPSQVATTTENFVTICALENVLFARVMRFLVEFQSLEVRKIFPTFFARYHGALRMVLLNVVI